MQILLADNHVLFRDRLRHIIQPLAEHVVVCEASDWRTALEQLARHTNIALILVDLYMPGMEPFIGLKELLDCAKSIPTVVVSASENLLDMKRALNAGVMGYIAKSDTTSIMLSALSLVLSGGVYIPPKLIQLPSPGQAHPRSRLPFGLTSRQVDVLNNLVQGKSNKQIARDLNLSGSTVKAHVGAIYKTLNVTSRFQAIRIAEGLPLKSSRFV